MLAYCVWPTGSVARKDALMEISSVRMDAEIYGDSAHLSGGFIKKRHRVICLCFVLAGRSRRYPTWGARLGGMGSWALEDFHARSHSDLMNMKSAALFLFQPPSPRPPSLPGPINGQQKSVVVCAKCGEKQRGSLRRLASGAAIPEPI